MTTLFKDFENAIEKAIREARYQFKSVYRFEFNDHIYYIQQRSGTSYDVQISVNDGDGINKVRTTLFTYKY